MHSPNDFTSRREFLETTALAAVAATTVVGAEQPMPRGAEPLPTPPWLKQITRMTFATPGEVDKAAAAGAQVLHTNIVWPYYPLKKDGGGLSKDDDAKLKALMTACRKHKIRM